MANECCAEEISALKEKIEASKIKVKELKDEYKNLLIKNLEKDVKIRNLKKKIEAKKYTNFVGRLPNSCIEKLRCIPDCEKEDSVFMSVVLNEIYGANGLKLKSLSGRSKNNNKTELTPEKKLILQQIYSERLRNLPPYEKNTREKKLTKILRTAIDVASRKT